MNSNQNPEVAKSGRIEATDDVEGHTTRSGRIEGPDTDDVEGHSMKGHIAGPDTDEVEGHAVGSRHIDGPDTDEVEGHGVRVKI